VTPFRATTTGASKLTTAAQALDANHRTLSHNPGYQAFQILHCGFVAAPFLAGLDKLALRDLGLCLGALALGRLSEVYDRRER
jgi:hypothetical protein